MGGTRGRGEKGVGVNKDGRAKMLEALKSE